MIKVEVTEENCKEVLKRKQDGENICPICVKEALALVMSNIFKVPSDE
jgi:uncharacterized Zn finger protein (UPF0148 family)